MSSPKLLAASEYVPNPTAGFENVFLLPFYQEGEFVVEFHYQPVSFWVGATLSFLGWVSLFLYTCGRFLGCVGWWPGNKKYHLKGDMRN